MIQQELQQLIHIGDRLTNTDIRRILQIYYDRHNLGRRAKATDLSLYGFITKRSIISSNGKRMEGVRVIKIV